MTCHFLFIAIDPKANKDAVLKPLFPVGVIE